MAEKLIALGDVNARVGADHAAWEEVLERYAIGRLNSNCIVLICRQPDGYTRVRTTAYHMAVNGMVERFHHQLKTSLRAAAGLENWTDHLLLVALGICPTLKHDLDCSASELVFGTTVRLPVEMSSPTARGAVEDLLSYPGAVEDPTNILHSLLQFLRTLSPVPPRSSASPSYLEKDLATCSHVYLRCDQIRWPLEPPYDGPFRELSRGKKTFHIQRDNREEVVSVDRLKAAVPDTPPDETCCTVSFAPSPPASIPPSRNPRINRPERRTALVACELALYKVDFATPSESRFSKQGQLDEVGAGYTLFWSGRPKAERRDAGVAFAIQNDNVGPLPCLLSSSSPPLM
nr:unnamed protein product [Spirometra erinaceieuropaei]